MLYDKSNLKVTRGGEIVLDVRALKAEMVRNGYTQAQLAKEIGVSSKTFSNRLKTGDFGVTEIEIMMRVLHLKDPFPIFFGQ